VEKLSRFRPGAWHLDVAAAGTARLAPSRRCHACGRR
jgi:hypothetical protein